MGYRVIQWATGSMGKTCLRAIIDHPDLELAGLLVYSTRKAGVDAGDIARRAVTGIIATQDIEAILALDADVVIHAARISSPYGADDAELQQILRAGKNVISINGHTYPQFWGGERLAAFTAACAAGGSSFMGAGLNPGFIAEKLAVTATSLCSQLDVLETVETVACHDVPVTAYVFDILGFGCDPESVDPNDSAFPPAAALNGMYQEVVALTATRLNLTLDSIETDHAIYPATDDLTVAAGLIPRGRASHFRWRWHGIAGGKRRITSTIHWVMETAHLDDPNAPLWRVHLTGMPNVRISVELERPAGDTARTTAEQLALAGSVINAIPIVCQAKPGVILTPLATPYQFPSGT